MNTVLKSASAPTQKGLIKLHKPIRPLINFMGVPMYKLSKVISRCITNVTNEHNIKNSEEPRYSGIYL